MFVDHTLFLPHVSSTIRLGMSVDLEVLYACSCCPAKGGGRSRLAGTQDLSVLGCFGEVPLLVEPCLASDGRSMMGPGEATAGGLEARAGAGLGNTEAVTEAKNVRFGWKKRCQLV